MAASFRANRKKQNRANRPSRKNAFNQVLPDNLRQQLRDAYEKIYKPKEGGDPIAKFQIAWGDKFIKDRSMAKPPGDDTVRNFFYCDSKTKFKYWVIDGYCQVLLGYSFKEWEDQQQQTQILALEPEAKCYSPEKSVTEDTKAISLPQMPIAAVSSTGNAELPSAIASPNWTKLCLGMLNHKKKLTIDCLTGGNGQTFEQLDFVPLGLLEQQTRNENEANRSDYEVIDDQMEFFEQVLHQGKKSPKSKGRRLAIIGESGAGKTTLLLKIGFWVLEKTEEVPIWIDMRDVGTKPLDQYLKDWLKKASGKLSDIPAQWIADLEERLQSGRVCLLLDGVEKLATIPEQLTGWEGEARVVINCRTDVWNAGKEALFDFDIYKTLGFSSDQVKQFIESWFPNNANQLWVELDQPKYKRIKDLVKNPLYLTFLCRIWQPLGKLPNTKAKLIQKFLEQDHKQKNDNYDKHRLINVLGELALKTVEQDQSLLPYRAIFKEFNKSGVAGKELYSLAIDLGWLKRVSPHEDVYDFLHDSFRDYFAAIAIPKEENWHYFLNPSKRIYRIFELKWKEIILLWLGSEDVPNSQKEALLRELVNFQDGCGGFYRYRAYFIAATGILEVPNCQDIKNKIVTQLVEWKLASSEVPYSIQKATIRKLLEINLCEANTNIKQELINQKNYSLSHLFHTSGINYTPRIGQDYKKNPRLAGENLLKYPEVSPNDMNQLILLTAKMPNLVESIQQLNDINILVGLLGRKLILETPIQGLEDLKDLINLLIRLKTSRGEWLISLIQKINLAAKHRLVNITSSDTLAIYTLLHTANNHSDIDIRVAVTRVLGEAASTRIEATKAVIQLLKTTHDMLIGLDIMYCLSKIHRSDLLAVVVESLKEYVEDDDCFAVLWHCAKNMPYPEFYQAWNGYSM